MDVQRIQARTVLHGRQPVVEYALRRDDRRDLSQSVPDCCVPGAPAVRATPHGVAEQNMVRSAAPAPQFIRGSAATPRSTSLAVAVGHECDASLLWASPVVAAHCPDRWDRGAPTGPVDSARRAADLGGCPSSVWDSTARLTEAADRPPGQHLLPLPEPARAPWHGVARGDCREQQSSDGAHHEH